MSLIQNPILRGFNADPSIIRVEDTYYIANSTFEWFPGVRLHESKDLKNWNLLPSPLSTTTLLDMKGNPSSGGIWAPALSWADGQFWLVYTDVKVTEGAFKDMTNYLTTAKDIRGPWSDPIKLNGVGFDASLFHDDDGRKYIVQQTWDHREYHHPFDGITLTELDTKTLKLMPETARTIYRGTAVALVEGPHLYKLNGYYYLFAAQGGTVFTHQEVVARSKTLEADSFETEPGDVFLTNVDTPDSYIQKQKGFFHLFLAMFIVGELLTYVWSREGMHDALWLAYIATFIKQWGLTSATGFMWALVPEVIAYGELKSGKRNAAIINAIMGLFFKIGFTIGGAIPLWLLAVYGFNESGAVQSASAIDGIIMTAVWIPIALAAISMVIMQVYPISDKHVTDINRQLDEIRV
ncbi:family 43 glycosylhydrolase [Klebsiella pneumoniae]|uniref:family 43 glycosylhydrolase n=1 Tax=Klebsiella pneumoniae TaxID=573 RepID=UPI003CE73035